MLFNFFIVSVRNLFKHKVSSLISACSLAMGILFAFVIFKFTAFERSFDKDVPESEQKVRLNFSITNAGTQTVSSATAPYPFTDLFSAQSPEIEQYARFYDAGEGIISFEDRVYLKTRGIVFADQSLLDFFGVPLLKGNNIDDHDLRSAAISSSLAKRLFGNAAAVGKTITYLGTHQFEVKGVFDDLPDNSSVNFHLVVPTDFFQSLRPAYYQEGKNWGGYSFHTYYKLLPGTDMEALQTKLNQQYYDRFEIEDLEGEVFGFELMPLVDVHLNPTAVREQNSGNTEAKIRMMELLSFVILVIAWINFINLQSTKAPQRMKEIGVRKVFGAGGRSLYLMFFLEFILLNLASIGLAIGLLAIFNPLLPQWATVSLDPSLFPVHAHAWLLPVLVLGLTVSSVYPAILTVRNGAVLKSTYTGQRRDWLKKGLVTLQFSVSLFMIAYTLVVYRQVQHMSNQDPGFDSSQILMVNGPVTREDSNNENAERLKQMALQEAGVEVASWAGDAPGISQGWQGNIAVMDAPETLYQTTYFSNITNDFFEVFDFEILAGRVPLQGTPHNEPRLVINEKALEGWGWSSPEEAIGKRIGYGSGSSIVAVVENFNSIGFQRDIDPRVFIVDHLYRAQSATDYFMLKVDPRQAENITAALKTGFEDLFPGNPFEYSFLNHEFEGLYRSEIAYNKVFTLFSVLAIALACVGMLGLARHNAMIRKREVGIRKVLGSGELGIVKLFVREYFVLILLAFVLSLPVSYYLIEGWLSTFAYRIAIGPGLFLAPLSALITLTLLTVGGISFKAAQSNPVEVLKDL